MSRKRSRNNKFPNATVIRTINPKLARTIHGDDMIGRYWPYAKFTGHNVSSQKRNDLIRYLMETEGWSRRRSSSEINKDKKMFKAYLKGYKTFKYKGDVFTVDTDIARSRNAAEKLFPIINTEEE